MRQRCYGKGIIHTMARSKFRGLWYFSQSLALANSSSLCDRSFRPTSSRFISVSVYFYALKNQRVVTSQLPFYTAFENLKKMIIFFETESVQIDEIPLLFPCKIMWKFLALIFLLLYFLQGFGLTLSYPHRKDSPPILWFRYAVNALIAPNITLK